MPNWSNVLTSAVSGALAAGAVLVLAPVELQGASPGTKQAGHINVSGTILSGKIGVGTNAPVGQVGVATTANVTGVHSRTGGIGLWGQSSRPGTGYGGYFSASGTTARGVFGEATSSSGATFGGDFLSRSSLGVGVSGRAPNGTGVQGNGSIGVLGTGALGVRGQAPIAGQFLGDSSGVEAFANESGTFFKRALHAFNTANQTGAQLGSSFGGVYTFDTVVGEYKDSNNVDRVRQISPVAFGTVNSSGGVTGTDNITTAFNGATDKWEIIPRLGTDFSQCMMIVTPMSDGHRGTASTNGAKFFVEIRDSAGNRTNGAFSFIVMRTRSIDPL